MTGHATITRPLRSLGMFAFPIGWAMLIFGACCLMATAQSSGTDPKAKPDPAAKPQPASTSAKPDQKPAVAAAATEPSATATADPAKPDPSGLSPEKGSPKDQLAADTARLYQLANELKAEMDKSTRDTLSLNVIRKADELEKLAKKVRAEMRASMGVRP